LAVRVTTADQTEVAGETNDTLTTSGKRSEFEESRFLTRTMKIDAIKATKFVRGCPLVDSKAIVGLEKA
jgi:ribosomal protein L7/L12